MNLRPMTTAAYLTALQTAIFARQLRRLRAGSGDAETGIVVEAGLAAIVEHLRVSQGPEAAFNTLARWADKASEPLLATNPGEAK